MPRTIETTLVMLFAHPITRNISRQEVSALFTRLGATVETCSSGFILIQLNAKSLTLNASKSRIFFSNEQVLQIREFLQSCGICDQV